MQAAPVQNHQSGPPRESGAVRGPSLFAGRKSARKAGSGAFAAFFARFQSSDRGEGSLAGAREAKATDFDRQGLRKPRTGVDAQREGSALEPAKNHPVRLEGPALRQPGTDGPRPLDDVKAAERDAKAARAKAKDRQPDADAADAAQLVRPAPVPKADSGASAQSRKEGDEGERSGKLEEGSRKRGKTRREETAAPELKVVDLRLKLEGPSAPDARGGSTDGDAGLSALQARAEGAEAGSGGGDAPSSLEAARGKSFTEVLAARLGNEGALDIVKAAQIVLKDGDSGLIRLRLEPESLGGVKIELRLAEKSIEGRILVESEEAKAAFEKALDGLKDAFAREGFESSSLEVSVGSEGREGNPGAGPGEDSGPFWSERLSSFDRAVPTERAIEARRAEGRVDILA